MPNTIIPSIWASNATYANLRNGVSTVNYVQDMPPGFVEWQAQLGRVMAVSIDRDMMNSYTDDAQPGFGVQAAPPPKGSLPEGADWGSPKRVIDL